MEFPLRKFSIIICLILPLCLAAPQKPKKIELNRRLGHNQDKIRTILTSILPNDFLYYTNRYSSSNDYNPNFRPRGVNETSEDDAQPNPTIAWISLKSISVSDLNDTDRDCVNLKVSAKLGVEFMDFRLAFEAPDGIKFVQFSQENNHLWFPRLIIGGELVDLGDRYHYRSSYDFQQNARAWISPEGMVYHDLAIERRLTSCNKTAADNSSIEVEMQLKDDKDLVEDVQLEWAENNAVTLKEETVKSFDETRYKVSVTNDKCKLFENFGSFGDQEFGCLTTSFVLTKHTD